MRKKIELVSKWSKMLLGKSVFHTKQSIGKYYKIGEIGGYYSDLRHKVTGNTLIDKEGIPINITNEGDTVYFAITIFQYGLGAYDLYLETKDKMYLEKFYKCVNWGMKNQENSGAWNAFSFKKTTEKYSSMAQGEGASLLIRAYIETKEEKYIIAARKALNFMLLPIQENGTTLYKDKIKFTFEESSKYRTILNGAIFSIWGVLDYVIVTGDEIYSDILTNSVNYLASILNSFDCGYWSYYDLDGNITSPFYHDLHIEQLKVMFDLFTVEEFKIYAERWSNYNLSSIKRNKAFVVKVLQKLNTVNTDITLVK